MRVPTHFSCHAYNEDPACKSNAKAIVVRALALDVARIVMQTTCTAHTLHVRHEAPYAWSTSYSLEVC